MHSPFFLNLGMEPAVTVNLVRPARVEDIRLGAEVELSCGVQAHPPATMNNILWFHNGNARLPNMQALPNGNLHIASFGMQHVGSFHCRVIHAAGKVDSRPPFVIQMTGKWKNLEFLTNGMEKGNSTRTFVYIQVMMSRRLTPAFRGRISSNTR